ncbi:MAG: amino acid adenylation domain-containing protein [Vicinamibacterales bacterium]
MVLDCPDAIALLSTDGALLTYAELTRAVADVSAELAAARVAAGDRVAIVLPNGPQMAVAFLGAAAIASAAPLNPTYREREFEFYLSDLSPAALLVEARSASPAVAVAERLGIPVLEMRGANGTTASPGISPTRTPDGAVVRPPAAVTAQSVALVLHTSGTTSRPKIVALTHGNLCASARSIAQALRLSAQDRCVNVMPLFHIHGLVGALLSSLAVGASIVGTSGFDASRMVAWLRRFGATWYTAVPSMHQAVLARAMAHADVPAPLTLRFIRSCSSPLPPAVQAGIEAVFHVPVIEAYGMTEASHEVASNPLPPSTRKPGSVGRPTGAEVAVLDGAGRCVPPGTRGEVAVRGAGVAAGYGLTPESAHDPHDWFRTGDEGFLDRDGYLFLTGRLKELINRGGEKIAPREIDDVLLEHPGVAQALAFAVPDDRLGEDVAAVVVRTPGNAAGELELQEHVAHRLADFKVPRRIVFVDDLPKGPTGKPQRIGLAERLGLGARPEPAPAGAIALLGGVERQIADIWSTVLSVPVDSDAQTFFDLGGDSLGVGRVLAHVRAVFGVEISPVRFFAAPTIRGLANAIDSVAIAPAPTEDDRILPSNRGGAAAPLSLAQERLWLFEQLEPATGVYNQAQAFRLEGRLDVGALAAALHGLVERHEGLRARLTASPQGPTQHVQADARMAFDVVELTGGEEVRSFLDQEARRPFDLSTAPLCRATLVRRHDLDHTLLLTVHHIACDGWSVRILLRDLAALYDARVTGAPKALPEMRVHYADFAAWERRRLAQAGYAARLERRVAQLLPAAHGAPLVPSDTPRGRRRAGTRDMALDNPLSSAVRALAARHAATPYMVLMSAFQAAIGEAAETRQVLVGTPVAYRPSAELEPLAGFFVNTVFVPAAIAPGASFAELLSATRHAVVEALADADLPVQSVKHALMSAAGPPVVQGYLSFENMPQHAFALSGLRVSNIALPVHAAKDDLTLIAAERDGAIAGRYEFDADRLEAGAVDRLAERFEAILRAAIVDDRAPMVRVAAPPVTRRPAPWTGARPLTANQRLVWTGQRLYDPAPLYNVALLLTIAGAVDPARFARAVAALAAATDALRTVIVFDGAQPGRRVLDAVAADCPLIDMSSAEDPEAAADAWARSRAAMPFDLGERLFDAALLRLSPDRYAWYLGAHHIITDGWSLFVLCGRLSALYDDPGAAGPFPEFERYVEDEHRYSASEAYAADAAYWTRAIGEPRPALEFHGRSAARASTRMCRVEQRLGRSTTARILDRARSLTPSGGEHAPAFNLLGAVYAAFLHRATDAGSFLIGAPMRNREPQFLQTAGLFMQTVVLPMDVGPGDSFAALAARLRDRALEARRHQRYAIRNLRGAAYEVTYNFHSRPALPAIAGAPVHAEWVFQGHDTAAMALQVRNPGMNAGEFVLQFDFNEEVFDPSDQARAVREFGRLLEACVEDPAVRVGEVELLDPAERRQVLVEGNDTDVAGAAERSILGRFADQVRANPGAVAVDDGSRTWTYAQIDRWAGGIAARLAPLGAAPEAVVGLGIGRSAAQIATMLGILETGAAYLPIDPGLPRSRRELMARQSGARLIVDDRGSSEPLVANAQSVFVDNAWEGPGRTGVPPDRWTDALACVLYTSGSTGEPKGVELLHRGLANYTSFAVSYFGLHPGDRVLQFASLAFDTAAEEIYPALASGATLVLRDEAMLESPAEFMRRCAELRISVLDLPTTYFHVLMESDVAIPAGLRLVIVGGERLRVQAFERWLQRRPPGVRLVNGYGPTECTVAATFVEPGGPEDAASIGRPIWNTKTYVLDRSGSPVAPGTPGELYIGGAGVARGYRARPDLTSAQFVPDRFASTQGARLYRTGDRARMRADGTLEFLGRRDDQIKLRGFRIEPHEIEASLLAHAGVRDAVVIAREDDGPASARLIAYVVANLPAPSERELDRHMRETLPAYMVPSRIIHVPALGRTISGKIDRSALPRPAGADAAPTDGHGAPAGSFESAMAAIWREALDRPSITGEDNFFDLGGHSLLAMHLLGRIRERLGVAVPLRWIFDYPTLAELCGAISADPSLAGRLVASRPGAGASADRPPLVSALVARVEE